jgi:hypothetical protein
VKLFYPKTAEDMLWYIEYKKSYEQTTGPCDIVMTEKLMADICMRIIGLETDSVGKERS